MDTYDAFDLPDWLGTERVTWRAEDMFTDGPLIAGRLTSGRPGSEQHSHPLDLLAVDAAYPRTVCTQAQRHDAHQAWHFGEVLLLASHGRVAAAVPAVSFDPNLVVEAVRRVAKALGAPSSNFTVTLML